MWVNFDKPKRKIMSKKPKGGNKDKKSLKEVKNLKNELKDLKKKVSGLKKKNKGLKIKIAKLKGTKSKLIPGNQRPKTQTPGKAETNKKDEPVVKVPQSTDYSAKEAISKLKALKTSKEVLNFTQKEVRVSIKKLVPGLVKKLAIK